MEPRHDEPQANEVAMPCAYCGAETHQDVVRAAFWGERGLIAIEGIPARVCGGCGEQFYDDRTAQRIEAIIHGRGAVAKREIVVPVFELGENESSSTGR